MTFLSLIRVFYWGTPTTSSEDSNINSRSGEKYHLNIIIKMELKEYLKYNSLSKGQI